MYSISFCTAIRNRLHHLMQTLPQNLQDNISYPLLEFVILDYSSGDGLEEWIANTLADHLATGRLVYIQSPGHEYFERSKSRNLAFHAAKGDLVCNVDADNFTGKGFASYINDSFLTDENIFLTTFSTEQPNTPDVFGRICCTKKDFTKTGGYNEQMEGYGFEDHELIQKLSNIGLRREVMTDPKFFGAISHGDEERIGEEKAFRLIEDIYLSFLSPSRSDILYIFKNGTYATGCLVDRHTDHCGDPEYVLYPKTFRYEYALTTQEWEIGNWESEGDTLQFHSDTGEVRTYTFAGHLLTDNFKSFEKIEDKKLFTDMLMFYTQFNNRRFLHDDIISDITLPHSPDINSHRIITSSLYWPANEWHHLLSNILHPIFQHLAEENNAAFGILRLSKYRGPNICITWVLPYHQADTMLTMLHHEILPAIQPRTATPPVSTARTHSTFADFPTGQIAYSTYHFPTFHAERLDIPAVTFLSRQLTDIILKILAPEPIDEDTTFTLAFYLHALAVQCLGIPASGHFKSSSEDETFAPDNLLHVLEDNTSLLKEIINDLALPEFLNEPDNKWMKNWAEACASFAGNPEQSVIIGDISTLVVDTLGLPLKAKALIFDFIKQASN